MNPQEKFGGKRRKFLQQATAAGLMSLVPNAVRTGAWAAGSDAPEKKEVKIGFIPLTDCSSVVMASVMEFDKKYGIKIVPSKEASWAAVRDKLVNGELDAAHVLYGLIYGVQLGIGGPKKDMAILMSLNHNGQAITLSRKLYDKGVKDGAEPESTDRQGEGRVHLRPDLPDRHPRHVALLLAGGERHQSVHGREDHHRAAAADGGEHARRQHGRLLRRRTLEQPRHRRQDRLHRQHHAGHLEGPSGEDARHHGRVRAEESEHRARHDRGDHRGRAAGSTPRSSNRQKTAEMVADKSYVNTDKDVIVARMLGRYDNGIGKTWDDPDYMKFYNDGSVNFPYLSDGMWFLTQHRRWGLLKDDPDYLAVAKQVNRIDVYKDAAAMAKAPMPKEPMRTSKLIDGVVWDGKDPKKYAGGFKVKVA